MAKKSYKLPDQTDEGISSCIWGLISMLDFCQVLSTQNLLPDRKNGSWRHVGTGCSMSKLNLLADFKNIDEKKAGRSNLDMPSVRTPMEEEMSNQQCSKKNSASKHDWKRSNSGYLVNLEKNQKKTSKDCNSDLHVDDLKACQLDCHDHLNPAALTVEYYIDDNQCHEKHVDGKPWADLCPYINSSSQKRHNHHDVPDAYPAHNHCVVHKAIGDVAEATMTQKSLDAKMLTAKGVAHPSKEFMDALEILNSNKELFIKLLEDPNSLLSKHIEDLKNAQVDRLCKSEQQKEIKGSELLDEVIGRLWKYEKSVNHKLSYKQSEQKLFGEKNKPKGTRISIRSDASHSLNKIVILRPRTSIIENPFSTVSPSSSPQSSYSLQHWGGSGRVSSYILKAMIRKLSNAFGKSRPERHPVLNTSLPSETSYMGEHTSQPPGISIHEDNKTKPKECRARMYETAPDKFGSCRKLNTMKAAHRLYKESLLYEEAKKRLAQMVNIGHENKTLPDKHAPRTLWGLLSLQQNNFNLLFPKFSPGRVKELDSLSEQDGAINHSSLKQDSSLCTVTRGDDGPQALQSDSILPGSQSQGDNCTRDNNDVEGKVKILEIAHVKHLEEHKLLDAPSELHSNKHDVTGSYHASELSTSEENKQPVTLPHSLVIQKLEVPGNLKEEPERPSPISVLEPFFSDDVISPGSSRQSESIASPGHIYTEKHDNSEAVLTLLNSESCVRTCIKDKKAKFNYVRTILEASGLCFSGLSVRTSSSEQLLDPSFFDEAGTAFNQLLDDPKLLFDCMGEVLMENQERLFTRSSWMSIVRPNVRPAPLGENFIQEVWKGIDRHLHFEFECTLDQLVGKDMDSRTWMDLQFETEGTVLDIGEGILEDLMEEIVLSCGFELSFLLGNSSNSCFQ